MDKPIDKFTRKNAKHSALDQAQFAMMGKIPPQAVEFEDVVLGAVMLEREAIHVVSGWLPADAFYKDEHKEIFTAILNLHKKNNPIDILTVTNELRNIGKLEFVGGAYYISELTNRVSSAANIDYHAKIVYQKYMARTLINANDKLNLDLYSDEIDVFDAIDEAQKNLLEVSSADDKKATKTAGELMITVESDMIFMEENPEIAGGVSTGFSGIDKTLGKLGKSNLIIMAARPGMGKTALTLTIAKNATKRFTKPTAFFSLEMSDKQLIQRLVAAELGVSAQRVMRAELTDSEKRRFSVKIPEWAQVPLYIDDTPSLSIFQLRSKARRLKAKHGIELIIVDYLQLMRGMRNAGDRKVVDNREQEVSIISKALKELAKELDVPVLALSQLSRAVEQRGNKKPVLADLRESGSIEQDADQVLFIYRPEYYGLTETEDGKPTAGLAEIIVAKNRHGALGEIPLFFHAEQVAFYDERPDWVTDIDIQMQSWKKPAEARSAFVVNDDEAPF